jgi:hypothetical protein
MKLLIASALFFISSASFAANLVCTTDLPVNNEHGLPANWQITIDTVADTAIVEYSGGQPGGVFTNKVISRVLANSEQVDGFEITDFGYQLQGRTLNVQLGFGATHYRNAEIRFRMHRRTPRRGLGILAISKAQCSAN